MENVLEQQRLYHEERERLIDGMVGEKLLLNPLPPKRNVLNTDLTQKLESAKLGHKQRINTQHRIRNMLTKYKESSKRLSSIYTDSDGGRREEISALSGSAVGGGNNAEFKEFYSRLKCLKEYHRKNPEAEFAIPMSFEFDELHRMRDGIREMSAATSSSNTTSTTGANQQFSVDSSGSTEATTPATVAQIPTAVQKSLEDLLAKHDAHVQFSDPEMYGRYLDLYVCHSAYQNLKYVRKDMSRRVDYVSFVSQYDSLLSTYPTNLKLHTDYSTYLTLLISYLKSFIERVMPLADLKHIYDSKMQSEFNVKWSNGEVTGWTKEILSKTSSSEDQSKHFIDLSPYSNAQQLESVGMERLKLALHSMNLKCGGTVRERAERLYATKGKKMDEINQHFFKDKTKARGQKEATSKKMMEVGWKEFQIGFLTDMVASQRKTTRDNVERKMAHDSAHNVNSDGDSDDNDSDIDDLERELDNEANVNEANGVDDEADAVPYNPKNIPLGWDGKPIPYWLYKLHGLNISYSCEICGNQTYKGPKAFTKHFSEWRHAHGMRCLGIPNTAHFSNVTTIEDAMALWTKLKDKKESEQWHPAADEEFEDSHGNVISKQTFVDLKRQGML